MTDRPTYRIRDIMAIIGRAMEDITSGDLATTEWFLGEPHGPPAAPSAEGLAVAIRTMACLLGPRVCERLAILAPHNLTSGRSAAHRAEITDWFFRAGTIDDLPADPDPAIAAGIMAMMSVVKDSMRADLLAAAGDLRCAYETWRDIQIAIQESVESQLMAAVTR